MISSPWLAVAFLLGMWAQSWRLAYVQRRRVRELGAKVVEMVSNLKDPEEPKHE